MKTGLFALTALSAALLSTFTVVELAHAQADPVAQVDALEGLFGKHPTARRSGAKGLCASGTFTGTAEGAALSSAAMLAGASVPVTARFSLGGGNAKASDKSRSVRGMALAMTHPGGQQWQMSMISAPVFFVSKPEQFAPFLQVRTPEPGTGKPNADRLKAFNDANPETLRQAAYLAKAPIPASYGTVQYWSTNAFEVTNAGGQSRFVRWQFVPEAGTLGLTEEQMKSLPDDFLGDELRQRVARAPVAFRFQFQLAQSGDPINDPTAAWPEDRQVVNAGRLVIDRVEAGPGGACDKIMFNPLALPTGIKPSADPVLLARPAPYAVSLGRRLGEVKP
ncbi:MAG: catalase family peroxidase [Burkholderiales bacterium]|nr:catalase family peroxidase [Burkholderiales bacterium]